MNNSKKTSKLKRAPKFNSEEAERKFWLTADSTKYVDYTKGEHWVFPNLKLSSQPITLRLPVGWIERAKIQARKTDMPYQTLLKQFISKGLGLA